MFTVKTTEVVVTKWDYYLNDWSDEYEEKAEPYPIGLSRHDAFSLIFFEVGSFKTELEWDLAMEELKKFTNSIEYKFSDSDERRLYFYPLMGHPYLEYNKKTDTFINPQTGEEILDYERALHYCKNTFIFD